MVGLVQLFSLMSSVLSLTFSFLFSPSFVLSFLLFCVLLFHISFLSFILEDNHRVSQNLARSVILTNIHGVHEIMCFFLKIL